MHRWLLVLTAVLLAGCATAESEAAKKAELEAKDDARCQAMGYQPGTLKYDDCRAALAQQREQIERQGLAGRLQGKLPQQLPTQ